MAFSVILAAYRVHHQLLSSSSSTIGVLVRTTIHRRGWWLWFLYDHHFPLPVLVAKAACLYRGSSTLVHNLIILLTIRSLYSSIRWLTLETWKCGSLLPRTPLHIWVRFANVCMFFENYTLTGGLVHNSSLQEHRKREIYCFVNIARLLAR